MGTAESGPTTHYNKVDVCLAESSEHADDAAQQEVLNATVSNTFVCDICKNRYSRIDHLARHFRKHTTQKPISCPRCSKSFSRTDTLKRHMGSHQSIDSHENGTVPGKRRLRASKACFLCAQSKLRCEGDSPCKRCRERTLPCRFPQSSRSKSSTPLTTSSPANELRSTAATCDVVVCLDSTSHKSQSISTTSENRMEDDNRYFEGLVGTVDHTKQQVGPVQVSRKLQENPANCPINLASFHKGPTVEDENIECRPSPFEIEQSSSTDFYTGLDLSNYHDNGDDLECSWDTFNFDILDFGALETQALSAAPPNSDALSGPGDGIPLGENAFKQSFLLYTPMKGDHWLAQTADLTPALNEMLSTCISSDLQQHTPIRLHSSTRYRILSSILSVTGSVDHHRILASFPSLEVLEYLLSVELAEHSQEADSWLHVPSFDPNTACTELVIGLIIAGAFRSNHAIVLKLAFALHEFHQPLVTRLFREDARNVRSLEPIQCFVLMIQAGLWSGNSRRMEISESFLNIPINMMKRGGSLRFLDTEGIAPPSSDNNRILKERWLEWIAFESRKRLALHLLILSTQYSMAFLNNPPLTHADVHASLPAAPMLWSAPSAETWLAAYLSLGPPAQLTLRTCIEEPNSLFALGKSVDIRFTTLAVLSGLWFNTWQYKERLKARDVTPGATQNKHAFCNQALYQEARESLERFATVHILWVGPMDPSLVVLHERQLMYLHVSLKDLQSLGGKDGEREARRVLPRLEEWAGSRSCRQAMWHAGQILREARRNGDPTLRVSTMIATYHASLILWSYSIMPKSRLSNNPEDLNPPWKHRYLEVSSEETKILLDGDHNPLVQRFCVSGFGKPCITRGHEGTNDVKHPIIEVVDQSEVMAAFRHVLGEKYMNDYQDCPNLVANLIYLIGQLGRAAEAVQCRRSQCM